MGLLDLPTELLLEINTHLSSPVDILNLSAASKSLRNVYLRSQYWIFERAIPILPREIVYLQGTPTNKLMPRAESNEMAATKACKTFLLCFVSRASGKLPITDGKIDSWQEEELKEMVYQLWSLSLKQVYELSLEKSMEVGEPDIQFDGMDDFVYVAKIIHLYEWLKLPKNIPRADKDGLFWLNEWLEIIFHNLLEEIRYHDYELEPYIQGVPPQYLYYLRFEASPFGTTWEQRVRQRLVKEQEAVRAGRALDDELLSELYLCPL